ncbi:hypothetical protein [Streptomyces venezuelae]|uniref:Uncharacterized protein n=1 Tax=Streptomyces venezuelae TaxID=54571 RepID=A0A5P2B9Y9_STRVZ|nr:hypothetical protein [Streptomyces venezuelae]QES27313.1 hypothetical protein DEJ47_13355 [Streptomyces venezuelae]
MIGGSGSSWPGPRVMTGDSVMLTCVPGSTITLTGTLTVQGKYADGQGFIELRLPDADPQLRRLLQQSRAWHLRLFHSGGCLYDSPWLKATKVVWEKDGLVAQGVPGEAPPEAAL